MKQSVRIAAIGVFVAAVAVAGIVTVTRTLLVPARPLATAAVPPPPVDPNIVAQHLSQAIRYKTVSGGGTKEADRDAAIEEMYLWFEKVYPYFHEQAPQEAYGAGHIFVWRGTDSNLPPVLIMAHLDVAPVTPGTEKDWTHAPFAGDIADGFVWGRGAIDNKSSAIALLEAGERLAAANFQPRRTVIFAFGQDTELGGAKGNAAVARTLMQRGVHLAWVLDEGTPIVAEPYPGVAQPVAFVSVAEKGSLRLELTAKSESQLSAAISKVRAQTFPSDIDEIQRAKINALAPLVPFGERMKLANLWLLKPAVLGTLEEDPRAAASLHTMVLPAKPEAAEKDAGSPRAVVELSLRQRDTIAAVTERVKRAINDPAVEVKALPESAEPSKAADVASPGYRNVARAIAETFAVPVVPDVMNEATDSRHYLGSADAVLRFRPFPLDPSDRARVRGANERVAIADLGAAAGFYLRLIQNSQ